MRVAFYLARNGDLLDKTIDLFSGRGGFSHCEYVFHDGQFCSSSPRDGGVRFKQIDITPGHWTFVDLNVSAFDEEVIRAWCRRQVGKPYDYFGVIGFVIPVHATPHRFFCSELLVHGLRKIGKLRGVNPATTSPNQLYKLLSASCSPASDAASPVS